MNKNELYHWKYVKRKRIDGKWRYWYDLDTFNKDMAALAGKIDTSKPAVTTKISTSSAPKKQNVVNTGKSAATKAINTVGNRNVDGVKDVFDKAKTWLDAFVKKSVDKVEDVVDDVKDWIDDLVETKDEKAQREAWRKEQQEKEAALKTKSEQAKDASNDAKEKEERATENRRKEKEQSERNREKEDDRGKGGSASESTSEAPRDYDKLREEYPESLWGELDDIVEFDDMIAELKEDNPMPSFDIKDEYMSKTEDMDMVNPNYDPNSYGYSMNCSYCTLTYEMRRRGYDVEALPANPMDPITIYDIAEYYEGEELVSYSEKYDPETAAEVMLSYTDFDAYVNSRLKDYTPRAADVLTKELLSHGEGARGEIDVYWISGGGHSMAWEVENGKVVIRDSQTNTIYRSTFDEAEHYALDLGSEKEAILTVSDLLQYTYDFHYMRTDNVEINEKEALKRVKNREG